MINVSSVFIETTLNCKLAWENQLPWWLTQMGKNLPAMQGIGVQSLGQGDPLEEEMATHSNILAWRIPPATVHGVAKSQIRLSD